MIQNQPPLHHQPTSSIDDESCYSLESISDHHDNHDLNQNLILSNLLKVNNLDLTSNSPLSQLDRNNNLNQNINSKNFIRPEPVRQPSIGQVNSSLVTKLPPRQHIPSFYGDQEDFQLESQQTPSTTNHHQNHQNHQSNQISSEIQINEPQEVLQTSNPQQLQQQHRPNSNDINHNRQTWQTGSTSFETDSEFERGSDNGYASGHSISSEDPFQYWRYETGHHHHHQQPHRQSTHPLPHFEPQISSLKLPPNSNLNDIQPNINKSFNTPPRSPSIHPTHDFILHHSPSHSIHHQKFSSPQSLTPSTSHSIMPSVPNLNQISPNQVHFKPHSPHSPHSPRSNHSAFQTHPFENHSHHLSNQKRHSKTLSVNSIQTSIHSHSSADTNSSKGSRLSWKNLFHFKNKPKSPNTQPHPTINSPSDLTSNNQLTPMYPSSDSPSQLAFSSNQPYPSTHQNHLQVNSKSLNQLDFGPQVDVQPTGVPSYQFPSSPNPHSSFLGPFSNASNNQSNRLQGDQFNLKVQEPINQNQPTHHSGDDEPHRLSIYSLPATDDINSGLDNQLRYFSRSPASSTIGPKPNLTPFGQSDLSNGINQRQINDFRNSRDTFQRNNLPSAMAKTKASLVKSGLGARSTQGQSAHDYLQAGIEAHESGDLERAAGLFERSARENGGCGAGMLMWGLSLRHGWGCQVNEARAFKWLQKAAESVIETLDEKKSIEKHHSQRKPEEEDVAKNEIVLAIYELGQCFMRGWGCKKDKQLAISYFELAAKLGDPDAQQELGFCYSNGKGTKKDLKLAAKYYRMASKQGYETMGSQWIWKEKYN
ncbi:hypothetical protein O181_027046 [Austropuccinia psidii MF-1]|uniref:HCP-like protein n=1 Tax=Austropuccinia psidii MF-1 TaxID=1389203 RepID=A0A9Q3H128_9BASI|nr:hypothetical protein [Austropuccinia psidii MF-1]